MAHRSFKDNFSNQSGLYARHRPRYPHALYTFLAAHTSGHELAWDCGTGNGQAALDLAAYYKQVIATDPSEAQVRHAVPHEQVTYRIERAEESTLDADSADLVIVANALHWMDFERFYSEVDRVMKRDGLFAAWTYKLPVIDPRIDEVLHRFHYETLDGYWLPENELIEEGYATIPFPFIPLQSPPFTLERAMSLDDFTGYISTWSATQRFIRERHCNPADQLKNEIQSMWGAEARTLRWELIVKAGRKYAAMPVPEQPGKQP